MNAAVQRFVEGAVRDGPIHPRVDRGLPLALSVRKEDRHYDPAAARLTGLLDILLDGDRLNEVTSYDIRAGIVVRVRRDWRGRVLVEHGAPVFETLTGIVEVRWCKAGEERR